MNKLGFGFLRLPKDDDGSINYEELNLMVDTFLGGGGRYFDTAYTYLGGESERALKKALVERHPRDSYTIADKLPGWTLTEERQNMERFEEQLERVGVEYFDVYLLHWLNGENYAIAERLHQFEFISQLKREGRAKKIGFSYHGDAKLLEKILTAHPEVDIVQLQINYFDWDNPAVEAKLCYECASRHGKEVVVMEPVKGGVLADLPEEAEKLLSAHSQASNASWAIRYAASLDAVSTVLSGMSTTQQVMDNLAANEHLTEVEYAIIDQVNAILSGAIAIPCTACRYCESHCPMNIPIPDYFAIFNAHKRHPEDLWKTTPIYWNMAAERAPASACISCHECERNCPQGLKIASLICDVAAVMEK